MRLQESERGVRADAVSLHEDALGLLDGRAAAECALQALELRKPAEGDVEGALQVGGVVSVEDDIGEHASPGRFVYVARVLCIEKRDHRASGLPNDRGDLLQCMLAIEPESHEGDLCACASAERRDIFDVDPASDDLMAEPIDDGSDALESFVSLVGYQHLQAMLKLGHRVRLPVGFEILPWRYRLFETGDSTPGASVLKPWTRALNVPHEPGRASLGAQANGTSGLADLLAQRKEERHMPDSFLGSEHRDGRIRVDCETDGIIAVCVEGEFDLANASAFRDEVDRALETGNDLIVDLSHATYIDSSVISILFDGAKAVNGRDQAVVLQLGTAPIVERTLELVGVERVLRRAHSRTDALEMIQRQETPSA